MNETHHFQIAEELQVKPEQVKATANLFAEGGTVPFIARYRKEATGSLDEVAITQIRDRLSQLEELDRRKETILKSLDDRSLLTEELRQSVLKAKTLNALEDIYQPYRPKRRTKAMIAREQGLEPLADTLFENQDNSEPLKEAAGYVSPDKGVDSPEKALEGARHILAERMNDDANARSKIRELFFEKGMVTSKVMKGKEESGTKFKDYFDWSEPVASIPSHRLLAIRRGEAEEVLTVRIRPSEEEEAHRILESLFVTGQGAGAEQVKMAANDCYKRLLGVSMEGEVRLESKKRADEEAIRVFSENLRELLMAPRLGEKNLVAIDPGFRTGCKTVCLDRQGKLLYHDVIYPDRAAADAAKKIRSLCDYFKTEAIAIGNGTAARETEAFIRQIGLPSSISVVMVNESGASVYSASEAAREEFPDHDITVRGAVSIGRRLMDPLAELVKIDPKSIGVGQYQHDVDQRALKKGLDDVVISCVNAVGVEVNTASRQLLSYVSGVGPQIANNIIQHRNENGPFHSRAALKKVPRLGAKAFEQAAGFLRIRDAENPLDASAVHPESYYIVEKMAKDREASVRDLMKDNSLRNRLDLSRYVDERVGLPTLNDIVAELLKPGRDPRGEFEAVEFKEGIHSMEDLAVGMKLPGIVTNVTAFGAFVDVGVHQDGLVHISQLADHFIKDPGEVVKVHQKVSVTVVDLDLPRRRIGLSMRSQPELGETSTSGKSAAEKKPKRAGGKSSQSADSDWFSEALQKAEKWKR